MLTRVFLVWFGPITVTKWAYPSLNWTSPIHYRALSNFARTGPRPWLAKSKSNGLVTDIWVRNSARYYRRGRKPHYFQFSYLNLSLVAICRCSLRKFNKEKLVSIVLCLGSNGLVLVVIQKRICHCYVPHRHSEMPTRSVFSNILPTFRLS